MAIEGCVVTANCWSRAAESVRASKPGWLARMSRPRLKAPAHISSVFSTAGAHVQPGDHERISLPVCGDSPEASPGTGDSKESILNAMNGGEPSWWVNLTRQPAMGRTFPLRELVDVKDLRAGDDFKRVGRGP